MENNKQADDLVKMLDKLVTNGSAHIDVKVQDPNNTKEIKVKTVNSQACLKGMACQVPTLHEGLDGKE